MVTHRGTGQNDVTVHLAAEPAGLPGSQTTLWSFSFTEATTPPRLTKQKQCLGAMNRATRETSQQAKRPNDTKFSGERSESAATRC